MSRLSLFSFLLILIFFLDGNLLAAEEIKLPSPKLSGKTSLEEAIHNRRSERDFLPNSLSLEQLSQLLWAAQGITDTSFNLRAAPSAGALYPLRILALKSDGVFEYLPTQNKLKKLIKDDKRPSLVRAALGQNFIAQAPVVLVITGNADKTRTKFGLRADRYVYMEAGHAAENICLQAAAMGLGAITVASFWDDVVAAALECPADEAPIYIIPLGYIGQ